MVKGSQCESRGMGEGVEFEEGTWENQETRLLQMK